MDEITNADQLEAWLKDRPREDAVLIAARCALRVFPLIVPVIEENAEERRATIILPIWRAMVVASVSGTWPTQATELQKAAAAAAAVAAVAARAYSAAAAARAYSAAAYSAADAAAAAAYSAADAAAAAARAYSAAAAADDARVYSTAAARATYANGIWKSVDDDVNALVLGWSHERFNNSLLWHARTPAGVHDLWRRLRDHLLAANEGWEVWTDWYQNQLDGQPANEELEVAKALIPNEIWEAGPATLNAEIARLIAKHEQTAEVEDTSKSNPVDATDEVTLRLADTDFRYDGEADAMVAIPFEEDAVVIDDPFRLRDRADLLSSLTDQASGLAYDLRNDPNQAPRTLARDLDRYAREARQDDPAKVRARHLETLIAGLRAVLSDEDIRMGLGNYLLTKLEQLVVQHDALLAGYFVEAANAVREAKSHTLPAGTTTEQLDENLERATELITGEEWRALPSPPVDYPDELEAQRLALREMASIIDLKTEGEERNRQIKMVQDGYVTATATVSRLIGKTLRAAGGGNRFAGAANITTVSMAAIALLKVLLGTLGLPI